VLQLGCCATTWALPRLTAVPAAPSCRVILIAAGFTFNCAAGFTFQLRLQLVRREPDELDAAR
jgi:hypothetical protein